MGAGDRFGHGTQGAVDRAAPLQLSVAPSLDHDLLVFIVPGKDRSWTGSVGVAHRPAADCRLWAGAVSCLLAQENAARGKHVAGFVADESCQEDPRVGRVLQAAVQGALSEPNFTIVLLSTFHVPFGLFQENWDLAVERGFARYPWDVYDCMATCQLGLDQATDADPQALCYCQRECPLTECVPDRDAQGQIIGEHFEGCGDRARRGPFMDTEGVIRQTTWTVPVDSTSIIYEHGGLTKTLSAPTILTGSPTFSYQLFPGGADWVFEWDTDVKTDLTLDNIQWYFTGSPPTSCQGFDPGYYQAGDPGVELSAYPNATGWHHKLILRGAICSPVACPMEFIAYSGFEGYVTASTPKSFGRFKVCLQ